MKRLNRFRNGKGGKALQIGVSFLVVLLLTITVGLVVVSRGSEEVVPKETTTSTTTETTRQTVEETRQTAEDPEKLLEEIGEEQYMKEELALDDSEENVKIEEPVSSVVMGYGDINFRYPYYIMVNRQANCVTVFTQDENGEYTIPVKAMVCSVGISDTTPLGTFKTSDKYEWRYLFGDVYGQYAYRINKNILFHSVPYYTKDKWDLETEEYNKLGEAASLGCIRLTVEDAKWLIDNCPSGTTVTIYDSPDPGPLGKPTSLKIDLNSPYKGWDPTDPDSENPWADVLVGNMTTGVERTTASTTKKTTDTTKKTTSTKKKTTSTKKKTTKRTTTTTRKTSTTTSRVTTKDATAGVELTASTLLTINKSQSGNLAEAIFNQITVKENGVAVHRSRIQLDISSLSGQSYGIFTVNCKITNSKGNTIIKPLTVLIDLKEPIIGGGNKTVTATSENELLQQVKSYIWVTDNSGKDCTLDITLTKTAAIEGGSIYRIQVIARDEAGNQGVENFTYTVYGM